MAKVTGHASFEVDESFVFANIADQISEEERSVTKWSEILPNSVCNDLAVKNFLLWGFL